MQVVIDIPNIIYEYVTRGFLEDLYFQDIRSAIMNGTKLPKGHGDLIDKDKLWDAYQDMGQDFYQALDCISTIIEADKEEKNADSN